MAVRSLSIISLCLPAALLLGAPVDGVPLLNSLEFTIFGDVPVYGYEVINTFPHDSNAFTQGLVFENDVLYEGTGLCGHSTLRKVELETGNVLKSRKLADEYFGEGITIYKDTIIQLTYQSGIGFVYIEKDTFELLKDFNYSTEGWGITHNGTHLIMSDGSSTLYFLNPETFEEVHTIEVRANGSPVNDLNELEYIKGEIYANVWYTDRIAIIDPQTGEVVGWIDLEGLLDPEPNVLNGIAYDADNERLFVTGKYWPKLFEIEVLRPDIKVNPDSLGAILALNDSTSQTIMISNVGGDTLTFSISESTLPPGVGGGPDAYGYRWIDSDESGGPTYDWIDITEIGTQITGLGDDDNVGFYPIDFSFPFYDTVFDSFRFCTNGWISFTHTTTGNPGYYMSYSLPNTAPDAPNNILAAFWDDLDFSTGGSAYYYSDGQQLVIEFYDVPHRGSGGPYTFEIILKSDGTIIYQYKSIGSPSDSTTVGIQNDDGTIGLQVVRNTSYIHDNLAIRIYKEDVQWLSEDPLTGSVPPVETEPITVTFNSTGLVTDTTYKVWLEIRSNDPDEPVVSVPVTLDVTFTGSDVGPVAIMGLPDTVFVDSVYSLEAHIANFGTDTVENFNVVCNIDTSGFNVYTDTNSVSSIGGNDTITISFANWVVPEPRVDYTVTVFTLFASDTVSNNDTLIAVIHEYNDTPLVSELPDTSFAEDDSLQIDLDDYVFDSDDSDSVLNWSYSVYGEKAPDKPIIIEVKSQRLEITSQNRAPSAEYRELLIDGPIYVDIDFVTHIATVTADTDWNGARNITFIAQDPWGLSNSDTMLVTVIPINDTPTITYVSPSSPCTVGVDTLTLLIHTEDPDDDSLIYEWSINGVIDSSATDTIYQYYNTITTIDTIMSEVTDTLLLDSTMWIIFVDATSPEVITTISPSMNAYLNDSMINFAWHPGTDTLSGIANYVLQYTMDSLFSTGVTETTLVETTFTDTLSDTIYYWKVKAVDKASNKGDWSEVWSFEIDTQSPGVPTLISPISGVYLDNTSVGFQWSEVKSKSLTENLELDIKKKIAPLSSPVRYILQVDTVVDFSNPVVETVATTYDTASLIEWNYYWRVRAYDLAGNQGSFANLDSFGVDVTAPTVPQLALPDSGIITNDSSVTFVWYSSTDNLSGVDYYILEYANNYLFIDVTAESLSDTSYTTNLPDTVYYWRAKSVDIATNESSWSSMRNFLIDTQCPSAPALVAPIDSLTTNDSIPVFIWHPSSDVLSGVNYYTLQYADNSEFTDATEIDTVDTTYIPAIPLSDTAYYWKVKAVDTATNSGSWSLVWNFIIDTQTPAVPTLVAPSDSSILSDDTPTFAWGKVTKSDFSVLRKRKVKLLNSFNKHIEKGTQITYNLRVICGADSTVYGTQDTAFTIPDTLDDSIYLWQVETFDEADNRSGYSSSFTLFIDTQSPQISNTTVVGNTSSLGPFPVHSTITDNLEISKAELWYKTSIDTNWASILMDTTGVSNEYLAEIPSQSLTTTVSYYIYSEDIAKPPNEVKDPVNAPDSCYSFKVIEVGVQNKKIPQTFFVAQNYPNPFIGSTVIEYGLPKDVNVDISIYNLTGQKVATLVDENKNAGYHTVNWDGKDKSGKKVASGIYFCKLEVGKYIAVKKMYLIR